MRSTRFLPLSAIILTGIACSDLCAQVTFERSKHLPSETGGWSGSAVAIDGDRAIVGAPRDDALGDSAGAAYILDVSDPTDPVELFRITAADGAARDNFGLSVSIGGGYAVVGAPSHFRDGEQAAGVAYIFDAATGDQLHRLEPAEGFDSYDRFGNWVMISGDDVFVGAPGYGLSGAIFRYDLVSGVETARLVPNDPRSRLDFGANFAIDGDMLVSGTPSDRSTPTGFNQGSVFVFDLATNTQLRKFFAATPVEQMYFGAVVAVEEGRIAVATGYSSNAPGYFVHDADTGAQLYEIVHPSMYFYETALAMDEGRLLIGQQVLEGSVFLHDAADGELLEEFVATDGRDGQRFGFSVALDGPIAFVGAPWDNDGGGGSGATYIFQPRFLSPCGPVDLVEPYGFVTFFDLIEYVSMYVAGDAAADLAAPFGTLNFADVEAYLNMFTAGCP